MKSISQWSAMSGLMSGQVDKYTRVVKINVIIGIYITYTYKSVLADNLVYVFHFREQLFNTGGRV